MQDIINEDTVYEAIANISCMSELIPPFWILPEGKKSKGRDKFTHITYIAFYVL